MARKSKITDDLKPKVLEKSAEGWSADRIKEWLQDKHGIDIHRNNICKFMKKVREDRKAIAANVYAEVIAGSCASDLEIIDKQIKCLDRHFYVELDENRISSATNISRTIVEMMKFKVSLNGIELDEDKPSSSFDTEELLKGILARLDS